MGFFKSACPKTLWAMPRFFDMCNRKNRPDTLHKIFRHGALTIIVVYFSMALLINKKGHPLNKKVSLFCKKYSVLIYGFPLPCNHSNLLFKQQFGFITTICPVNLANLKNLLRLSDRGIAFNDIVGNTNNAVLDIFLLRNCLYIL